MVRFPDHLGAEETSREHDTDVSAASNSRGLWRVWTLEPVMHHVPGHPVDASPMLTLSSPSAVEGS